MHIGVNDPFRDSLQHLIWSIGSISGVMDEKKERRLLTGTIMDLLNLIKTKVTKDDKIFWSNIDASNSFYYLNLCGYTSKHHLPLREYLNKLSSFEGTPNKQIDDDVMEFLFKNT